MEMARPPVPDKPPVPDRPPVAAKPKLRPAPPRPPKPSTPSSLSTLSTPLSVQTSDSNHHDQSHSKESHAFQNGLAKTSSTSAVTPKHTITVRANSAETLSSSSKHAPPRPPEPPRRGTMSPSSSLSLPASFRNKRHTKSDLDTSLAVTTSNPITLPSTISPSLPQRSPISHASPARKAPPILSHKPALHVATLPPKSTSTGIAHNTRNIREETVVNDLQLRQSTPEKNVLFESESSHLEAQTNSKPSISVVPVRRHSATPPQRPTSPPSRPVLCAMSQSTNSPTKSSTSNATIKQPETTSVKIREDVGATDNKTASDRKLIAPPPLPKHPPRGGVPRKARRSSFKLTPSSDPSVPLRECQIPEPTEAANDNANIRRGAAFDGATQADTAHLNSQTILQDTQNKENKLFSDTDSNVVSAIGISQSNNETKLHHVEDNSTDSYTNKPKAMTPPKPRPRTRPSLLSPSDIEGFIQQSTGIDSNKCNENSPITNAVEGLIQQSTGIDNNKCEQNSPITNAVEGSALNDVSIENKPELEYAEVYQGDSDSHHFSHPEVESTSQTSEQFNVSIQQPVINTEDTCALLNNLQDPGQSDTFQTIQNTEVTCAISRNPTSLQMKGVDSSLPAATVEEINTVLTGLHRSESIELHYEEPEVEESHLDIYVTGNVATKHTDIISDSKSLFQEEPEATCDMLKEIEELLKNKLGNIELDLGNISQMNSQLNEDSEYFPAGKTSTNCEVNFSSRKPGSSPSTSPVRPPRPKRQASIKQLGSMESLNASIDSSSTECLANSGLTKTAGPCSGKKKIPAKPKRCSLPHVSRSHSDVTGMKPVGDSISPTSEAPDQPLQEDIKPFLPPRLESLRRYDSSASCQGPPPLPPRNKPPGGSLKEIDGADSELPELPSRGSLWDQSSSSKTEPEVPENLELSSSKIIVQPGTQSAQYKAKPATPVRPRPIRKAPPPPPASPKRSATFSSGDYKQSDTGQSMEQADKMDTEQELVPSTLRRSSCELSKRTSTELEDHYHEISESIKARAEACSQEREEPAPPALPPRIIKESNQVPLPGDVHDDGSIDLSGDCARYVTANPQTDTPENPKTDKSPAHVKSSSPKELKHMEKMAKSALIQKVAQSFGFGKSFKISRVPEITLVVDESKKVPTEDIEAEKLSTNSITVVDSDADTEGSDPVNSVPVQVAEEFIQKATPPTETFSSAASPCERPLSEVSQHSTSSEHEESGQIFETQNIEEIVSSGTDTEPEEDEEEIYATRKAKKVFFIAKEIVSSESTFVDVLMLLNLDFRLHISKSTENLGHVVIPTETLNKILDFLPQLQNFNEDLLKDLNERIENWETNPRLADIFVKKGPFLKLYSSYIRNFENATGLLEDTAKKNSVFASALKEFELSPRCAKLALKHYMLKPIQRIPQYKLLLQDYLKHLMPGSLDFKDTINALNIVSEVADHANDSMRHGDNVQKLLEVQRSLIGQFEVIQPGRVLVKQGELQKLSRKEMQPRMFFLFNDVLLYTTPVSSGYKINNILPLTGMKINSPKLEDYKFEFNIISVQRSFTLSGSSPEVKEQWVSALQTAIDVNAKKYHTFQTVKQGPQTSLLDKDFVLGHKAPLWVPDARVTMCMLCLLEFTLTWRRHHCRSCGRVVCSHCSENKAPLRYLNYEPARVCDNCFEKLRADMTSEYNQSQWRNKRQRVSQSEEDSFTSVSEGTDDAADSFDADEGDSGLSLNSLMARFQKIRITNRDKRKPSNFRPSVLKEVRANDEGSDLSGYLRAYRSRKWKRLWFVVKGKVLYTYKASEDMAAAESMPLLGYEVTRLNTWFDGAEPDLLFELTHQNNQPLLTRKEGEKHSPRAVAGAEKTTQRLIFRTDSAAATIKWVTVLKEASLTYQ